MTDEEPIRAVYYHGEVVDERAEGYGFMKFSNGYEFTGMFIDDLPGGIGVLTGPELGMYVGNVSGIRPHGFGVVFHKTDGVGQPLSLGNFVNGVADGFQISLGDIHQLARKDIVQFVNGVVSGKGMRAYIGQVTGGPMVPEIFEMIDGEPVYSKEELFRFGFPDDD
tara:strand:- start:1326 stop:1823 length:498 start_codon:yes stop_codon:yes gene_type:complete